LKKARTAFFDRLAGDRGVTRSTAIALGFVGLFLALAIVGAWFGDGVESPLPQTEDLTYTMPNNVVLIASKDGVRQEIDPASQKTKIVAPDGFKIVREVPASVAAPAAEPDPCRPEPEKPPALVFKDVREETHYGAVIAADVTMEEKDGSILVRVPNGGSLVERVFSFRGFWIWVAAFLTICILSFLYDDNALYKFTEHLFIGVSAAYWMCVGFWSVIVPNLLGKLWPRLAAHVNPGLGSEEQDLLYLIPLVFGIILLFRLSRRLGWLSRWALAFIVGTTAGLNLVGYLQSDFVGQIEGAIIPLVATAPGQGVQLGATFSAIVLLVGVLCSLVYFFFSSEHKGVMGAASRVGIWVLMITFGASFGYTVMGRIALLVGRMEFLFADWLHLIVK
jgi:hypothetical protein